jgi:hypothetical protein
METQWTKTTLEALRERAVLSEELTAWEALTDGVQRVGIVWCVTGWDNLSDLAQSVDLDAPGTGGDWSVITLSEVFLTAITGTGIGCKVLRGENGFPLAVCLIAATPDSVRNLESCIFG